MSIVQWGITTGTKSLLENAEKDGKIGAIAEILNKVIGSFFPDNPKMIRQAFVQHIIFGLGKELLKDDPAGYVAAKTGL